MTKEKAAYCQIAVGPGGRQCACCAPVPKILKRMEHKKARRTEKQDIRKEMECD